LFISQKLPTFGELYFYMHMKNEKNNRYIKTYQAGGGLSPAGYNAISGLGSMVGNTISSIPSKSGGVSMGASIGGGAVAGAAIGSVAGPIGTVIGGVVGAASGLIKGLVGKKAESRAIAKANHEAEVARGKARLKLYEQNKGPELTTIYKCGGKLKYANGGRIMIHTPYENGIVRGHYNGGIIPQEQAATINMKGMSDIRAGGTHQENPLGGVPIDNKNNFVEQGEFKYGKYVFSNRF
jgi:hypothetical protein